MPELDPAAVNLLQRSMSYLAGLPAFSVETESTLEVVLETGQKIQVDGAAVMTLQRPNKLYALRSGMAGAVLRRRDAHADGFG